MDIRRTVPVKLTVSDDDAESLHATITEFQQAANYSSTGFEVDSHTLILGKCDKCRK